MYFSVDLVKIFSYFCYICGATEIGNHILNPTLRFKKLEWHFYFSRVIGNSTEVTVKEFKGCRPPGTESRGER